MNNDFPGGLWLQRIVVHLPRLVGAACLLTGHEAVLLDLAGNPLWRSSASIVVPPAASNLPCVAHVLAMGPVLNTELRSFPCCGSCAFMSCQFRTVVPVRSGGQVVGALALSLGHNKELEHGDALVAYAVSLTEAVGARLDLMSSQMEADRNAVQLAQVVRNLSTGLLIADKQGIVTHASPILEQRAGRIMGKPLQQVLELLVGVEFRVTPINFQGEPDGFVAEAQAMVTPSGESVRDVPRRYTFDDIKGFSLAITAVKQTALRAAATDATILIQGESGTGKEVFAQAIHSASPRRARPFIAVNSAAVPDSLLESELFGYDEGAFTGARKGGKPGKFELAEGGTLFLDEIGDLPLLLQAKLLRVLQERVVERVGASRVRPINVRIIAATNRDLTGAIRQGLFREDLYYRLNVIPLSIPPLRQRTEDIHVLVEYFLRKYGKLLGKEGKRLTGEVLDYFHKHPWPGNAREMENAIQYVVSLENGPLISMESLPPHMRSGVVTPGRPADAAVPQRPRPPAAQAPSGKHLSAAMIRRAVSAQEPTTAGKRAAAEGLGISLATLYRHLKLMSENENGE